MTFNRHAGGSEIISQASLSFQMFHGQKNTGFVFLIRFVGYMSLFGDLL
jgi:hypothetical protein